MSECSTDGGCPQSFAIRAGVPCPTARQVHCCPLPDGCECPEPQWLRSYRRPQRVRAGNPSRPRALSGRNGIPSTLKFPDLIWPAVVLARFLCRFPFYAASRCAWIRNASPHPAFTELGCRTCRESFGGGPPPKNRWKSRLSRYCSSALPYSSIRRVPKELMRTRGYAAASPLTRFRRWAAPASDFQTRCSDFLGFPRNNPRNRDPVQLVLNGRWREIDERQC
jgi:hypothetical protein